MDNSKNSWKMNLMFMRTSLVVLAVAFLATSKITGAKASVILENKPSIGFACEGSSLTITCSPGRTIKVMRVNYGRMNYQSCYDGGVTSTWTVPCQTNQAIGIVISICEKKTECWILASNDIFGDACPDTPKYIEVQYKCIKDSEGESENNKRTRPPIPPRETTPEETTTTTTTTTTEPPTTTSTTVASTTVKTTTPISSTETTTTMKTTTEVILPTEKKVTFCDMTWIRNISWPNTPMGKMVQRPCPNNRYAKAKWRCGTHPVQWDGHPDLSECVSPMLADMSKKVMDVKGILRDAAENQDEQIIKAKEEYANQIVEEVTANMIQLSQNEVFGGDLDGVTKVMQQLVDQIDTSVHNVSRKQTKKLVENVNKAVVKSSSNLLDKKQDEAWLDLPQLAQASAATRVVNSVEESAFKLADTCHEPVVIHQVDINIVLEVNVIDTMRPDIEDVVFPRVDKLGVSSNWASKGNSIRLSAKTIREHGVDGLAKLIFATYQNIEQFLKPQQDSNSIEKASPTATHRTTTKMPDNKMHKVLSELQYVDVHPIHTQKDVVFEKPTEEVIVDIPVGQKVPIILPKEPDVVPVDDFHTVEKVQEVVARPTMIYTFEPENNNIEEVEIKPISHVESDWQDVETEIENDIQIVNTQVISASINGRKEQIDLGEEMVYYTLEHLSTNNIYNPTCSFWEYEEKTMTGHWSSFGCKLVHTNVTHSTCACNHMTNFAVLMNVKGTQLSPTHTISLRVITYIGCIVSMVCLFICIVTFIMFKNLQCDRNTIHKNLCICLFVSQLIFCVGIAQYERQLLCSIIAGVLHYFLLASFMWMFLEGLQLYLMLVEVFEAEKSRRWYYYAAGYGVPAIIIAVSAGLFPRGYGTSEHCWLTTEKGFIWSFVGPVIAVLAVNVVMLTIAIYKMCEHAKNVSSWKMKEQSNLEKIRSWVKGAAVLVVLLGLTWLFGLLYFNDHGASVFWAYVFTVLNSLQGCFIFIFHCLLNEKVQKEYKKVIRRSTWLPDCIRANYGGPKSYTSSTPNNTSSAIQKLWSGKFRKRSSATSILPKSTASKMATDSSKNSAYPDSGVFEANGHPLVSDCTEDPGGYLEPISLQQSGDPCMDYEEISDDHFSNMEGSCVESGYYGGDKKPPTPKPLIDFSKYRIQTPPLESDEIEQDTKEKPLTEWDDSDEECCAVLVKKSIDDEDDHSKNNLLTPLTDDEDEDDVDDIDTLKLKAKLRKLREDFEASEDDTLKLKEKLRRLSSDSGTGCSTSLNDLNKTDHDELINLTVPNIAVMDEDTDDLYDGTISNNAVGGVVETSS